jgi:hypothetical protein
MWTLIGLQRLWCGAAGAPLGEEKSNVSRRDSSLCGLVLHLLFHSRRLIKTMFQSGDAVIYFEHMASGEVRQHFGHILSVGQSGTYKVRLKDLPDMNLFFAYLTRAM